MLQIEYFAHACFALTCQSKRLLIDPYSQGFGYRIPERRADYVAISHDAPDHNHAQAVSGSALVIRGCAPRRLGPFQIRGELAQTASGQPLTLWRIDCPNEITVVHLGALTSPLSPEQIEALTPCHLLLAPVGCGAEPALTWLQQLKPHRVVPMRFRTPFTRREHLPDLRSEQDFLNGLDWPKQKLSSGSFQFDMEGSPSCLLVPHLYQ